MSIVIFIVDLKKNYRFLNYFPDHLLLLLQLLLLASKVDLFTFEVSK
jgi:hypothetical protein